MKPAHLAVLPLLVACGGGDEPFGPGPLVPDPAVETGCSPEPLAPGRSRAKLVDCAEELPAGRLVAGRPGDVLLENARIKVVIRGFGEGYYLMGTGPGGIVDAAPVGGVDRIKEILPIAGLNGGYFDEIVITEAGGDGRATVVVRGPAVPVPFVDAALQTPAIDALIEHHYVLEADADEVLIRTFLFPGDGATGTVEIGEALFYGGRIDSWLPGVGYASGTTNTELIASAGETTSYGIVYKTATPAVRFVDIANVKLALGVSRSLGNPDPVERWLIVGDGSASSITDRGYALLGRPTGTVRGTTAPGVDVLAVDDADRPITLARADAGGAYRLDLPAGTFRLTTRSEGRADGAAETVEVTAGGEVVRDLPYGGSGTLELLVRDDAGAPIPARVVLTGVGDRRIHYAGAAGELTLPLPPGEYTLVVSRGMEYDTFTVDPLVIADGAITDVDATVDHVLDTAGWISLDTHLHSEMSTDSVIPLDDRLLAVAAEGVGVAIASDHDFVTDYGAVIEELGLGAHVAARPGVEASSLAWGHVNAWPVTPNYDHAAGGAFYWYGRTPGAVFADMRARGAGTVIQVNHPYTSSSGLFHMTDFDPVTLTPGRTPAELGIDADDFDMLDFDAIEIANSFNASDFARGFPAWLALVAAGHPAAATGSSDSHGKSAFVGNSRTYVYVGAGADAPATADLDAVDQALKARKVVVAQGSFVTAAIVAPGSGEPVAIGALADLSDVEVGGEVSLRVRVQAPPWMPLSHIEVYGGTELVAMEPLDAEDTAAVRYDREITVPVVDGDGFYVVAVRPAGRGDPVIGRPDASFTSPLLYDRDGDGLWQP